MIDEVVVVGRGPWERVWYSYQWIHRSLCVCLWEWIWYSCRWSHCSLGVVLQNVAVDKEVDAGVPLHRLVLDPLTVAMTSPRAVVRHPDVTFHRDPEMVDMGKPVVRQEGMAMWWDVG